MAAQAELEYVHATQFTTEAVARFAPRRRGRADARRTRVPGQRRQRSQRDGLKLAPRYHLAHGEADRHVILRSPAYHGNSSGAPTHPTGQRSPSATSPGSRQTVRALLANPYRDDRSGTEHGRGRPLSSATGPTG